MQTLHTRTYTNVALTVLILLLLVLAVRPYVSLPTAQAESFTMGAEPPRDDHKSELLKDPYAGVAAALRELATSNKDIAAAIRETAQSQSAVAKAIQSLGASATTPAK